MDLTFDTVLLAVGPRDDDRVDRLARAVLQVAKPTGARVVLTHVFTDAQYRQTVEELGYNGPTDTTVEKVLDRHETVRKFEERFDEHGVDWSVHGVVSDVADGIVDLAGQEAADRVFVSGQRRSPAGKAVFGSTAQEVLLRAPCPVTYVRADDD